MDIRYWKVAKPGTGSRSLIGLQQVILTPIRDLDLARLIIWLLATVVVVIM